MKHTSLILALALAFTAHAADDKKAVDPAVEAAMKQVNATGASLMPVAADAKAYRFTALNVAKEFTDAGLDAIAPIADKIASLDIARSKVTDAGLAKVAAMKNLKELHLEGTAIGDAGLDHLKGLAELEYLNLYGTKVSDAGLAKLATATGLKKLFVWQTAVTQAGAKALEAKIPGLVVNIGLSEAEIAKLTAPPPAPPPAPAKKEEPKKDAKPAAKPAAAPAKPAATPAAKPAATPAPAPKPAAAPAKPAEAPKK